MRTDWYRLGSNITYRLSLASGRIGAGSAHRHDTAASHIEHSKRLEGANQREHHWTGTGDFEECLVTPFLQHRGSEAAGGIEHLGVSPRGTHLNKGKLARSHRGLGFRRRAPHSDHLAELADQPINRAFIGPHHDRYPGHTGFRSRSDRQTLDGEIAPAYDAHQPVERQELVFQADANTVGGRRGHDEASGAGSDSIGSDRVAPGGIIGKTFASCSITNSTSAGPGSRSARSTASSICRACSTR